MKHMEHHVMYMHAVPSFCVEYRNTIEVELIKIFFPATACKQNESPVIILLYVCVLQVWPLVSKSAFGTVCLFSLWYYPLVEAIYSAGNSFRERSHADRVIVLGTSSVEWVMWH